MITNVIQKLSFGLLCFGALTLTAQAAIITPRNNTFQLYPITADAGSTLPTFNMLNDGGDTGRLLVVTVGGETLNVPTSVTYAGQQLTLGSSIATGTSSASSIWYLINPTATTGSIVTAQTTVTANDNGYRVAAMSFGTDGQFLNPLSSATAVSNVNGSVSLSVTLDDIANPGNPYVAIGSYAANVNSGTATGFGTVVSVPSNVTADGGYFSLAGYTIAASGSTTLQITQDSSRHAFAGLAVSVAAIPEPSTWLMAALLVPGACLLRRKVSSLAAGKS